MTIDNVLEIADRLDGESRLAETHYANALDAQNQMRGRHDHMEEALQLLREGRTSDAAETIRNVTDHCPSAENVSKWFAESSDMLEQAHSTRAELREALEKLKELDETRVRHGGR